MTALALLVLGVGFWAAFANGANDVSKGIATLAGSGVTDTHVAIRWGAMCTGLGALAGATLAGAMLATFDAGLLEPGTALAFPAALATILAALAWVLLATRTGLPVSTTHALVGAVAGVGVTAYGFHAVSWGSIGAKIALPLVASPLVAFGSTYALARVGRIATATPRGAADCLCAEVEPIASASYTLFSQGVTSLVSTGTTIRVTVRPARTCAGGGTFALRLTLDHLHWVTSGATSFARGMNDAPKIAAFVLAAAALSSAGGAMSPSVAFATIAAGMVAGSLVAGRKVTRVLAEGITRMDHREGLTANLVTSCLVAMGAVGGLPMSTTHVSSAAILGMGIERPTRSIQWRTVRDMALAWVVTLPAAALLGALALGVLS